MSGGLRRWFVLFLVFDVIVVAGILWFVLGGNADVPCQDGHWDEARATCVPDPAAMP